MSDEKYKAAYERQKLARAKAEQLLEERSRELYESNEALKLTYEKLKDQKNQLYHQEKLASVGLLGAGVAHEINNPAGFVRSNLSMMRDYMDTITNYSKQIIEITASTITLDQQKKMDDAKKELDIEYVLEDIDHLLDESLEGIQRIERIVKGLKDFSRPDAIENENFSLNECIETTLQLAHNHTKYKAEVVTELTDIPFICGKPGSIGQVVLNLVMNASQAIEDFGKITLKTYVEESLAVLEVTDTGCGIPSENLFTIFDPFFTTKDLDIGTGLGLSITHGIVKQHNGEISVESEVGKGTSFKVKLPIGRCENKS